MKDFQLTIAPHYLTRELETWKLSFEHTLYTPRNVSWRRGEQPDERERMSIKLYASKGEGPRTVDVCVAETSFHPEQKPERICMKLEHDAQDFVEPLMQQYQAEHLKKTVEKHQDYPGADEIEEFHYNYMDLTEAYNGYMKMKHDEVANSVLSKIHQGPERDHNWQDRRDYLSCMIGGVYYPYKWFGRYNADKLRLAEKYPEYTYQVHDLASEVFADELRTYREAMQRVTDVKVLKIGPDMTDWRIRCKIDGVQQMGVRVKLTDIDDYISHDNGHALAAKYFSKELQVQPGLEKGMHR